MTKSNEEMTDIMGTPLASTSSKPPDQEALDAVVEQLSLLSADDLKKFATAISKSGKMEDEDIKPRLFDDDEDTKEPHLFDSGYDSSPEGTKFVSTRSHGASRRHKFGSSQTGKRPVAPGRLLSSGLQVRAAPRTASALATVKVAISKSVGRGVTPAERQKTRKTVVQKLSPQLACTNITRMLSVSAHKNYDIADDAQLWQFALKTIDNYAQTYDMTSIFMMPNRFDLHDSSSIHASTQYTNLLTDYSEIDRADILDWQEYLFRYGSDVDVESDNWMEETLRLSMEQTLKTEVLSDMEELPRTQRGAISMYYLMTKRMVVRNQEAKDAMLEWFNTFDIRNYDNQDVSGACIRIMAIARALGNDALPTNAVRRILNGFSHASNDTFKDLCNTTSAMMSSSLYAQGLKALSTSSRLRTILSDLESKYLELLGGKKWEGIGYEASAFKASLSNDGMVLYNGEMSPNDVFEEYDEARILAARNDKSLPFSEWVKTATCHHCGQKGHIKPRCPLLRRNKTQRDSSQNLSRPPPGRPSGHNFTKSKQVPSSSSSRDQARGNSNRRAFQAIAEQLQALAATFCSDSEEDDALEENEQNEDTSYDCDEQVNLASIHDDDVWGALKG